MALALRTLSTDDVDWITEACQDADVQRWTMVPRPYTRDHAVGFVTDGGGEEGVWAIVDDTESRGLGVIGVHGIDPVTGAADVGYWVAPWGRRRGAATFAVGAVAEMLAAREGVRSVTLQIAETNAASRGVATKSGFTDTGPNGSTCPDGCDEAVTLLYRLDLA